MPFHCCLNVWHVLITVGAGLYEKYLIHIIDLVFITKIDKNNYIDR